MSVKSEYIDRYVDKIECVAFSAFEVCIFIRFFFTLALSEVIMIFSVKVSPLCTVHLLDIVLITKSNGSEWHKIELTVDSGSCDTVMPLDEAAHIDIVESQGLDCCFM